MVNGLKFTNYSISACNFASSTHPPVPHSFAIKLVNMFLFPFLWSILRSASEKKNQTTIKPQNIYLLRFYCDSIWNVPSEKAWIKLKNVIFISKIYESEFYDLYSAFCCMQFPIPKLSTKCCQISFGDVYFYGCTDNLHKTASDNPKCFF